LKDLDVDGRIIIKWILKKWDGDLDWNNQVRTGVGERGNEPADPIKCGEFLDYLYC
jgi:hypothetical protein